MIAFAALVAVGVYIYAYDPATAPRETLPNESQLIAPQPIEYRNDRYGFTFRLPEAWEGYGVREEVWNGFPETMPDEKRQPVTGPQIILRHPHWSASVPRQDIPILVFTKEQWSLVQNGKLAIGAAPIPPRELGENRVYVFAIPARYNYAFPAGFEEVEAILADNPLRAFELR